MEYDYLIIGAGSAGCVLANRLSKNNNTKVCLIEAGPSDNSFFIKVPLGISMLMGSKKYNWCYKTINQKDLENREIYIPRGKTLGGSSSVNAMIYIRGTSYDYDEWESLGNKGWGWKDLFPIFKRCQHQERGENEYHGINGLLNVADLKYRHPISEKFIKAAIEAGFKPNNDFNGKDQEGVGFFQVTQKNGERFSVANAYLHPISNRSNLTIKTNAYVENLILDNKTIVGTKLNIKGSQEIIKAKEVILSAGAINSPKILLLSGIGSKDDILKHNIKLNHELPGVGKNLQDHPDALIVCKIKTHDSLTFAPSALFKTTKSFIDYIKNKNGQLTSNAAECGGFIKSNPQEKTPDLQIHFTCALLDNHGLNRKFTLGWGFSAHICCLKPLSRGTITLKDSNPLSNPIIDPRFLSHHKDMDTMIKAVKTIRNITKQNAIKSSIKNEIFPGIKIQSNEEIKNFLQKKSDNIYHPVGTCKMGIDDMAVVDPNNLKVYGIDNLRIIDASIMPTIISGNTNAPVVAIAEKAADMILQN